MWCTAICSWPMHTSAPFSKRSIASCQEPLKSTLYPFAGSPLKDLLYFTILYSTYRYWWILLRHNEACVCSHSRFIKQQTLFFLPPWVSQARSRPAVSPIYCISPTHHTFLSLIRWSPASIIWKCVSESWRNGGAQSSSSAFLRGRCGHLTAGWGGNWGLYFPCGSLFPNRATCSVSHLPLHTCNCFSL